MGGSMMTFISCISPPLPRPLFASGVGWWWERRAVVEARLGRRYMRSEDRPSGDFSSRSFRVATAAAGPEALT